MAQRAHGIDEHSDVVGIQDGLHGQHLGMPAKWLHRAENHGLPTD
jgi:hypothetical protein